MSFVSLIFFQYSFLVKILSLFRSLFCFKNTVVSGDPEVFFDEDEMIPDTKVPDEIICDEEILEVFSDHESTSESENEVSFMRWFHGFSTTRLMTYVSFAFGYMKNYL